MFDKYYLIEGRGVFLNDRYMDLGKKLPALSLIDISVSAEVLL
jgi:hypothetical protein